MCHVENDRKQLKFSQSLILYKRVFHLALGLPGAQQYRLQREDYIILVPHIVFEDGAIKLKFNNEFNLVVYLFFRISGYI